MNEVLKTIYERRAVRQYKDQRVDKATIEKIIDAGRMAPSAMNRQLWKFYVLTDIGQIRRLSISIAKVAEQFFNWAHGVDTSASQDLIFHQAPAVIIVTEPKSSEWAAVDAGMCCQNMMLAAKSMGLDTCPVGLVKFLEKTDNISELGMSDTEQIQLAVIVGYGNENPEVHPRNRDNAKFLPAS
jgi:nitroreductase